MSFGHELAGAINKEVEKEIKEEFEKEFGGDKDSKNKNLKDKSQDNKEKGTTTEEKIGKIDEIFDELLDKVKDAPEAQREALRIIIQQMHQIGDQMKQVRDMKNLQEMKTLMMKNWKELEKLAGGDPQLLKTIQDWGKSFVEEKVVYYELIGDVKDDLIDNAQKVQAGWDDMIIDIGKVAGLVHLCDWDLNSHFSRGKAIFFNNYSSGINKFLAGATDPESHYFTEGLEIKEINDFLDDVSKLIMDMSLRANMGSALNDEDRMERKEIEDILKSLVDKKKILSGYINEASKIFRVIKKVRDTHFLPLFNEQPERIAA
jgi:hypothetical protein